MEKGLKVRLIDIEERLDFVNGLYGTKESFCIFCGAINYNGIVGIEHVHTCIILKIRK